MRQVTQGSTNISVDVYVIDSTTGLPETGLEHNGSSLAMSYRRTGAAAVSPTMAALAALTTAHTDGGWEEIGNGYYRFDVPDAAFASGAESVSIEGSATGMVVVPQTIQLVAFDTQDTVRLGLTALPNAAAEAAGGLIVSTLGTTDADDCLTATGFATPTNITSASGVTLVPTTGLGDQTANITGNLSGSVGSLTGHTNQTADHTANIAAILTDTGTTLETHLTDIKGGTFSGATDSLEAVRDRGDAAWTTGAGGTPPQLLQSTTIATLSSQTSFTLTAGSTDDNAYVGAVAVITDASTSTQKAVGSISAYTGSTKTVTLSSDPAIFTMAATDSIDIIANASTAPTAVQVRQEIDSNSTQLAAIVADTNELQTDDVPGLIATLDAVVDTVKADTAAILTDTADIQPNYATAAELAKVPKSDGTTSWNATALAAINAECDTAVGTLNNISVADILTTQMTESYAADGAAPTLAQALLLIQQQLGDFSISGTTMTVKQVDGTTTAATFTLNDGTNPTSLTRAT